MTSDPKPEVHALLHAGTSTICYIVACPTTRQCAVIDAVLDFDLASGRTATTFAERVVAKVRELGLTVQWVLETHVHADHLSGAPAVRAALGGRVGIGDHIGEVQAGFAKIYNLEPEFRTDGSQFDHLFTDGEQFAIGQMPAKAMHTPGHTPACMTYRIGDAVFCGDTIFMPDFGTARCDFPGGSAETLYRSIQRILALPPETRIFVGHDYGPDGREIAWETTVAEQRKSNKHVHDGVDEAQFVAMRTKRDAELAMPGLLLPSIQVNIRAGEMPPAEDNGVSYLKLPLNRF
ncbi:MAG: MBL fold metallo-hydrolase [Alphaproteobacteria bacterium]|nr:MBL fold metallo-hydrolase [Alphaproteobacteria bacterium]MCB9929880.1 MBL fold metallo-hydrolase [Alphaproteobacteria bacterium]